MVWSWEVDITFVAEAHARKSFTLSFLFTGESIYNIKINLINWNLKLEVPMSYS